MSEIYSDLVSPVNYVRPIPFRYICQAIGNETKLPERAEVNRFRTCITANCHDENERHDAQVVSLRTLSYVWGSRRNALFAAFRSPTQRTRRQKTGCN